MSRIPDVFIGRVFVPVGKRSEVVVALAREKLWVNTEAPKAVTFRGGGPHGFLVEGKNLLVMGDERAFGQLGAVLASLDLTRYNPELFCEEIHERRNMNLLSFLFFQ